MNRFVLAFSLLFFASLANAADRWIVVTAPAFGEAIEPLQKQRSAQGFDVIVLNTTDILSPDEIQHDGSKLRDRLIKLIQPAPDKTYVLLVGVIHAIHPEDAQATELPAISGTVGRMKNLPTDNAYGCLGASLMPNAAVGRLPARNASEAKKMVDKILAYENQGAGESWRRSISLLVGNPGGATPGEQAIGNHFVLGSLKASLEKIDLCWSIRTVCHIPESPGYVPDAKLHDASMELISAGQAFIFYLGHSSDDGFWSNNVPFVSRRDLATINIPHGPGIFITCGCFANQLDAQGREDHEGYGLAAIRNANGPPAVVGATAESYSVAGKLAFDGLLTDLSAAKFAARLGDVWLNIKSGIAKGPVDPITFTMLDFGDGSNGTIPLEIQRQEHLEMWMLLGDPAMKLPAIAPEISLKAEQSGEKLHITGKMPEEMKDAHIRVTLERRYGATEPVEISAHDGKFEITVEMPTEKIIVRAVTTDQKQTAIGAASFTPAHRN